MTRSRRPNRLPLARSGMLFAVSYGCALLTLACSSPEPDSSDQGATGGAAGTGGLVTGGTGLGGAPSGGVVGLGATGAISVSGGTGALPTGGVFATGGASPSGGATAVGGVATGGVFVVGTGGGGAASTGGIPGTGSNATGGTSGTGGGVSPGATGGTDAVGTGGTGGEPSPAGDDYVSDVNIEVHPDVNTVLVVTWTQVVAADETWLEFTFPGGETMTSRPAEGAPGAHQDVVLGVPGETDVTVRIVNSVGGSTVGTSDYSGTTEAVPRGMPEPTILSYDATLASPERFVFGAVENSDGGCDNSSCYYHTLFWVYIMDRQGRIVWYYADPASNATSSFQRIARDGDYIWIEKRPFGGQGSRGVLKMTLDHSYFEEIPVSNLSDCIDVTDDGSLLYDVSAGIWELREMTRDGEVRTIWSCPDHFGRNFDCYSNTVNWNPLDDTVVLSFPYQNTVVEISRQTGEVVGQYGDAAGSYAFSPSSWEFEFQHFANITPSGTLLVSSHMPGYEDTETAVAGQHAFMEFDIDREAQTLTERWYYNEGEEWAMYKGMAIRLANGNTLANYGTGGVIREITPDKQTAFHVKFDAPTGDDFFNKMVGHNVLIDDLYALNGGGPQ